jgi:hypothetical protein
LKPNFTGGAMLKANILAVIISCFFISPAHASISIGPFLKYDINNSDTGTVKTTSNTMTGVLHGGYTFDTMGLYVGGIYDYTTSKTDAVNSTSGVTVSETDTLTAYGLGVGFRHMGFFVMAHYLLEPVLEQQITTTTKYKGGTGYEFNIGYAFDVMPFFKLGIDYRYLSYDFKKREPATGAATDISSTNATGTLMLATWFDF